MSALDKILRNDRVKVKKPKKWPKNEWVKTETKDKKAEKKKKPSGKLKLKTGNFSLKRKKKATPKKRK